MDFFGAGIIGIFVIIGFINLVIAFFCAYIAKQKNRHYFDWFFLGLLFGIVALIAIASVPTFQASSMENKNAGKKWFCYVAAIIGLIILINIIIPKRKSAISNNNSIDESATVNTTVNKPAPIKNIAPEMKIVAISTRTTEKNDVWWKYAWKLTVKVDTSSFHPGYLFNATIKWLDKDGFEVESKSEYNLAIKSGEQKTFTGARMISLPGARDIESIQVQTKKKK